MVSLEAMHPGHFVLAKAATTGNAAEAEVFTLHGTELWLGRVLHATPSSCKVHYFAARRGANKLLLAPATNGRGYPILANHSLTSIGVVAVFSRLANTHAGNVTHV